MTGKGQISFDPNKRLRLLVGVQIFWLALVFALGAWWGSLVLKQSARIAELENKSGIYFHTHRMLVWESSTYFGLLLASTAVLFFLYLRDARRSRGIQAFFASVTHELRTPLTSVRLQAESIADSLEGSDPQTKILVSRLLQDSLRLESQVERTLELARVEGGGKVFTQTIAVRPYIERLVDSWKTAYGDQVQFNLKLDDVLIDADASSIQVILRNLIENSVRHSKKEKVSIALDAHSKEGFIELKFSDDGSAYEGNPSELGQIFFKGRSSSGAGVGLYLVRVLMERMSGKVEFKNDRGFQVALAFRESAHG